MPVEITVSSLKDLASFVALLTANSSDHEITIYIPSSIRAQLLIGEIMGQTMIFNRVCENSPDCKGSRDEYIMCTPKTKNTVRVFNTEPLRRKEVKRANGTVIICDRYLIDKELANGIVHASETRVTNNVIEVRFSSDE